MTRISSRLISKKKKDQLTQFARTTGQDYGNGGVRTQKIPSFKVLSSRRSPSLLRPPAESKQQSARSTRPPAHTSEMHSFVYRLNTLVTFAVLLLGLLCAGASFLDSFNSPSVRAHVDVLKINRFRKQLNGHDEVALSLNISVDIQSAFTWNTKQVFVFVAAEYETPKNALNQISLWDHIIPDKDHAKFQTQVTNKYLLIDQGSNLRGKKIELVLHWHVMPKTGKMIQDKIAVSHFQLPEAYT